MGIVILKSLTNAFIRTWYRRCATTSVMLLLNCKESYSEVGVIIKFKSFQAESDTEGIV